MSFTLVTVPLRFFARLHSGLKMAYRHFLLWIRGRDTATRSDTELNTGHIIWNMTENASDHTDMLLIFRNYITEREREIITLRRQFRVCTVAIIILLLLLP
ncbi:TPA: hypothetical protein LVM22_001162 [Klebsiella oxytoca]|nr:hypothetical protein [Klebsiella oxytoca]